LTRLSVDPLSSSADQLTIVTVAKTALDEQTPITLRSLENKHVKITPPQTPPPPILFSARLKGKTLWTLSDERKVDEIERNNS
jgi:hypothetical protein